MTIDLSEERALLIIMPVQCACGHHWTDSELIFKADGYSYNLTPARYDALLNKSLRVEGKRVHPRLVPICHECTVPARDGWADAPTDPDANPDPHYPYELWPDKHKQKLISKARQRPDKTHRTVQDIASIADSILDDI